MKVTRSNVQKYAIEKGFHPIQVDGIPEGFSYESDGIHIGVNYFQGQKFAFIPLKDWSKGIVQENNTEDLLNSYTRLKNAK